MPPRHRDDDYALLRAGQSISIMNPERPILDWLNELPPGYRERAVRAKNQCGHSRSVSQSILGAIDAFWWDETTEGYGFWSATYNHYLQKSPLPALPANPLPDDGHGAPTPEPETEHTTHMDYSNIAVATVTLVYNEDVAGMDAKRCMAVIKAINTEIEDLQKVNAIAENAFVTKQIAERGAALAKIVERLNELASA